MLVTIENQTVEIDDKLVEKYNKCMQKRCKIPESKAIIMSTPSGKSKFYDMFKKHLKDKNES